VACSAQGTSAGPKAPEAQNPRALEVRSRDVARALPATGGVRAHRAAIAKRGRDDVRPPTQAPCSSWVRLRLVARARAPDASTLAALPRTLRRLRRLVVKAHRDESIMPA